VLKSTRKEDLKMEKYVEMKERHQKLIDELPLKFAFSNEQFKNAMEELGLTENDTDKVVGIGGGGFCLPETAEKLVNYYKQFNEEEEKAFKNDDFLQSAFEYELANHEYIITYDLYDTLVALNINVKEYQENERYQKIMDKAIKNYEKDMEKYGW
jgi:hypothetical protein